MNCSYRVMNDVALKWIHLDIITAHLKDWRLLSRQIFPVNVLLQNVIQWENKNSGKQIWFVLRFLNDDTFPTYAAVNHLMCVIRCHGDAVDGKTHWLLAVVDENTPSQQALSHRLYTSGNKCLVQ